MILCTWQCVWPTVGISIGPVSGNKRANVVTGSERHSNGFDFAKINPLRWSAVQSIDKTVAELGAAEVIGSRPPKGSARLPNPKDQHTYLFHI